MIAGALGVCLRLIVSAVLSSKSRSGPRLVLQPAGRRTARHTTPSALKRFFAIADAWELSPLQQCRLLKIPSPQVLARYRLGQAPRLSAVQQERAALVANIQHSLSASSRTTRIGAWAWVHAPREGGAFRRGQSALLHAGERPAGAARGGAAAGARKRAPLTARGCAILCGCSDANVAELVDAPGLEPGGETRASSSLAFRTTPCRKNERPKGSTCRFPLRVSASWSAACKCRCRPSASARRLRRG